MFRRFVTDTHSDLSVECDLDKDDEEELDLSEDFVLPRRSRRPRRQSGVEPFRSKRKPSPPRIPDLDDIRVGSLFRSRNPVVLNERFVPMGAEPILNNRRISWVEPGSLVTMSTRIQFSESGTSGHFFSTVKQLFDWADMIVADPKKAPGED